MEGASWGIGGGKHAQGVDQGSVGVAGTSRICQSDQGEADKICGGGCWGIGGSDGIWGLMWSPGELGETRVSI